MALEVPNPFKLKIAEALKLPATGENNPGPRVAAALYRALRDIMAHIPERSAEYRDFIARARHHCDMNIDLMAGGKASSMVNGLSDDAHSCAGQAVLVIDAAMRRFDRSGERRAFLAHLRDTLTSLLDSVDEER